MAEFHSTQDTSTSVPLEEKGEYSLVYVVVNSIEFKTISK